MTVAVVFRLIVFRPFRSEIVCGKIASANENGMKSLFPRIYPSDRFSLSRCLVRLDFFDDIWVPKENLFENSGLYDSEDL